MARDPKDMTAVEFELYVKTHLDKQGCILQEFHTEHLETLSGPDGDYVMDVTARFEAIGVSFLVVIECKRYTSDPVERAEVQVLQQKKQSVDAHKAIMYTTSVFRSGAVGFAKAHGIALVEVVAGDPNVLVKSWSPDFPSETIVPEDRSFADLIYEGNVPVRAPIEYPSKQAEVLAWQLDQMRSQIDYVRAIESRGMIHPRFNLDQLRADVSEMESELASLM